MSAVIVHQSITEILSINLGTAYTEWADGTSYAFGADVRLDHHHWRSAVDNNTERPSRTSANWVDMGAINAYAMLDTRTTSATTWTPDLNVGTPDDKLQFEIWASNIEYLGFVRLRSVGVTLEVIDGAGAVIDTLKYGADAIWCGDAVEYDWFFSPFCENDAHIIAAGSSLFFAVTAPEGGRLRVTVLPDAGTASVGELIGGRGQYAGCTRWGATRGGTLLGNTSRDDFGEFSGRIRGVAQQQSIAVSYDSSRFQTLTDLGQRVAGSKILFVGDSTNIEGFGGLVIYGIAQPFTQVAAGLSRSTGTWTIEEAV